MEIISTVNRRANKSHVCDFCGFEITKGTIYENQVNKFDDIYNWKIHLECKALTKELNMYDNMWYDEGLTADDFKEIVKQYLSDNDIEYLSWEDAYNKIKELKLKTEV